MANNFKVRDLIADNIYISENNGNVVNTFGDQLIRGDKIFSGSNLFTGDSVSINTEVFNVDGSGFFGNDLNIDGNLQVSGNLNISEDLEINENSISTINDTFSITSKNDSSFRYGDPQFTVGRDILIKPGSGILQGGSLRLKGGDGGYNSIVEIMGANDAQGWVSIKTAKLMINRYGGAQNQIEINESQDLPKSIKINTDNLSITGCRPTVNGSGILLSGENFLENLVYATGNQIISGIKTFSNNLSVNYSDLFVDTSNTRVGVNTNAPTATLDINGSGLFRSGLSINGTGGPYNTSVNINGVVSVNGFYFDGQTWASGPNAIGVYDVGTYIVCDSGDLIIEANTIFNKTSLTAPNQTITSSSSLLTKELADSLYGTNYFSITTGLSSGVDNDAVGKKVHSLTLPSGTWEFESYATLSGTVSTGSQGTRFYMYPNNSYSFYGQNTRNAAINSFATPQTSLITLTNSNLPFSLYNIANNLISASHLKGTLIINQQTEISIFISQNIQQTGQPIYLLGGSYLKARKIQ